MLFSARETQLCNEPSLPVWISQDHLSLRDVDHPVWYAMPGAHRLSSSPCSEASPGISNGRLNRSGSVDSLDDRSSTSSGGGGGGTKQINSENIEFIPTRSTKLTAPKPAYNPMQFVRVGPAKLHKTAREQIAQAEKVKKMQTSIKEEEEDWQSNLDNWKFSRRKRQEHVIVKLQEVKRLEEETTDRSKKRNKTFNEILQHRSRHGRSLSIPSYSNDEGEEWGDDDGQTKSEPESGIGSEGDIKDRKFMEDADGDDDPSNKQSNGYYGNGEVEYTYEKAIEDYRQYAESHSSKIKMLKMDARVDNNYNGTHSPLNEKLSGDSGTCSETSDASDDSEFHRKRVEEITQQIDICRSNSCGNVGSPRRKSLEVSEALKEKISSMQKQQGTARIENKTAYPERDHHFHRKLQGFQSGRKGDDRSPSKTTPERDVGFRDKLKSFSRIENGLKVGSESQNDRVVPERSQNFRDKLSSFESLKCVKPSAKSIDVRERRGFERTQSLSRLADASQTSSAPTSPSPYMYKVSSTPFLEIDLTSETNKTPEEDIMTKSETRKILPSVSFDSLAKLDASGVKLRPRPVNPLPKPSLKHRRTVIEVVEKTEEETSSCDEEELSEQDELVQKHRRSNSTPSLQQDNTVSRIETIPSFARLETYTSVEKKEETRVPQNNNKVPVLSPQNTNSCDKPPDPSVALRENPQRDDYRTLVYSSPNRPLVNGDSMKTPQRKEEAVTLPVTVNSETKYSPTSPPVKPKVIPGSVTFESPLFRSSDYTPAPLPPLRNLDNAHIDDPQSKWDVNPNLLSPTLGELPTKVFMDIRLDETSKNLILGDSVSQVPILEVELQGSSKEPPKEKPPPPPPDSDSEILDDKEGDPVLKRMGSTQRLKKDLRRRRSNFLGLDEEEEPKLEEILPPPPDVKSLMHEEIKFQKERERELLSQRSEEQSVVSPSSPQEGQNGPTAYPDERSTGRTWESVKLEASLYDGQLSPEDEEILREERKIIEALEKEEQLQLQRRTEYENYRIARLEAERRNMVADKSRREEEQLQQREMDPVTLIPFTDPSAIRKEPAYPNMPILTAPSQPPLPTSKPVPPDGFYGPVIAQTSPPRPVRNAPPAPPVKPRRTLPRSPQEIIYSNGPIVNGSHVPKLIESENKTCDMKFATRKKIDPIPKKSDYQNHWLIQEAEQRRITELQEREQHQRGFKPHQSPVSGYHPSEKALPENVIQTLTQRVQTKMSQQSYPHDMCSPVYENIPGNYVETKESSSPIIHPLYNTYMNGVPESPNQLLSVSGRKRCSYCSQELGRGAAMIIESLHLFYHIHCFKCCVCNTQLGNGTMGADVRVRNNKLHCQNCYSNEDGVKFSRV